MSMASSSRHPVKFTALVVRLNNSIHSSGDWRNGSAGVRHWFHASNSVPKSMSLLLAST